MAKRKVKILIFSFASMVALCKKCSDVSFCEFEHVITSGEFEQRIEQGLYNYVFAIVDVDLCSLDTALLIQRRYVTVPVMFVGSDLFVPELKMYQPKKEIDPEQLTIIMQNLPEFSME